MDRIEHVTVGELRPYAERVVIADYDPGWPETFATQRDRIVAALGETVLLIEHIGSTAVPGLAAKPIIDIVLAVPHPADEAAYVPAVEGLGYRLRIREPDWHEHRMLRQRVADGDALDVNLHVYGEDCAEIRRNLAFRDWLRTHAGDRERYAAAKRALARRRWRYVQDYADAKTGVVLDILARSGVGISG